MRSSNKIKFLKLFLIFRIKIKFIEQGFNFLECCYSSVFNEKSRKYDLIANEIALTYRCKVKIIPYVMIWLRNTTRNTEVKSEDTQE